MVTILYDLMTICFPRFCFALLGRTRRGFLSGSSSFWVFVLALEFWIFEQNGWRLSLFSGHIAVYGVTRFPKSTHTHTHNIGCSYLKRSISKPHHYTLFSFPLSSGSAHGLLQPSCTSLFLFFRCSTFHLLPFFYFFIYFFTVFVFIIHTALAHNNCASFHHHPRTGFEGVMVCGALEWT